MTDRRRDFLATFDPEVISDLRRAAHHLMAQICSHAPDDCDCELNRFTPAEFVDWLETEAQMERGKPVRIEPAGRPGRKDAARVRSLGLAVAG